MTSKKRMKKKKQKNIYKETKMREKKRTKVNLSENKSRNIYVVNTVKFGYKICKAN